MKKLNIDDLWKLAKIYAKAGKKLGAKITVVSVSIFWLEKGSKKGLFMGSTTPLNRLPAGRIAENKMVTKKLWKQAGLPIAEDLIVSKEKFEELVNKTKIKFPVVIKPASGTLGGEGIVTNIKSKKELLNFLKKSFKKRRRKIIVEEYYKNLTDYRVLLLKGKVIAVSRRIPAYVVGDSKHTISELIKLKNKIRKADKIMTWGSIIIDDELKGCLKEEGVNLKTILPLNKTLYLKNICNLGSGGETENVTDQICKHNISLAIKAAETVDLTLAGIDFLCQDISRPLRKGEGILLEINEHPGIDIHHYPQIGKKIPVAEIIIKEFLK